MNEIIEKKPTWVVALTGASGMRYALRLLQVAAPHLAELHLILSEAAMRVLNEEEGLAISPSRLSTQSLLGEELSNVRFHSVKDIGAPIASGSHICDGMVIVPCSMSTLGAIANGVATNLIHRTAEVALKERRPLILVPRETPLSAIHLENMLKLSRLGVSITPAMPGFYHKPQNLDDLVDMLVMKILDQMKIQTSLVTRWTGKAPLERA